MKNITDVLDSADIEAVTRLIDGLNGSTCDFLQVEIGDMKLTIGKGEPPQFAKPAIAPRADASAPVAAASVAAVPAAAAVSAAPAALARPAATTAAAGDGVAITASIMGRFYAKPEPGAAPFVTVGSMVEERTTVALIEVMKMFTPVLAGVRGVVAEVCVADSDFVEFGQTLFRVKPQP